MIKVKNNAEAFEIYVNGDITSDCDWHDFCNDMDIYPSKIKEQLDQAGDKAVNVYINSPGGDLFSGVAIHNMLKNHTGKTKAIVQGLCASSASIVAFGCDEIEMPSNTYLMIHKPTSGCWGNSSEMRKMADVLDKLQEGIVASYSNKKLESISDNTLKSMIDDETWMTGEDAARIFNIKVTDSIKINNKFENLNGDKIPDKVFSMFKEKKVDESEAVKETSMEDIANRVTEKIKAEVDKNKNEKLLDKINKAKIEAIRNLYR